MSAGSKGIQLFTLGSPYYLEGSPVIVSSGVLLMGRFSEEMTARLKLRNITDKKIVSCEVRLTLFDARGTSYEHELFYKFDGMTVPRNREFGFRRAIPLPDNLVRSFAICVTEVTFSDFTRWENTGIFGPVAPMETLTAAFQSEEMAKQFTVRYGEDCRYLPTSTSDLWYCACGAVNHRSEDRCYACSRKRAALEDVNVHSLRRDTEDRRRSEEVVEAAERRKKEKKKQRGHAFLVACLIIFPILLVAGLILSTVPPFLERRAAYAEAESLLASGRFMEAENAFLALDGYSDAADRARLDVPYEKAVCLMDCAGSGDLSALPLAGLNAEQLGDGDPSMALLDRAEELFASLDGYRESADALEEIARRRSAFAEQQRQDAYLHACALLDENAWMQAAAEFRAMGDYLDAPQLAQECFYRRAAAVLDFCEKQNVRHIFLHLSDTPGVNSAVSMPGSVLAALGSDIVGILKSALYEDGVDFFYEDTPGTSEGSAGIAFLPICEAAAGALRSLGAYKDAEALAARADTAGDFISGFYALLHSGDLDGALTWINTYDDPVPERDSVAAWAEMYAPFRGYWMLEGGDTAVIPASAGRADGERLNEFSARVCIEGEEAVLLLEQPDGEYTVRLTCPAGSTDFAYCPDDANFYYGRINHLGHFIYMRYLASGRMATSCEYYK